MTEPSDELMNFAFFALDHAAESVLASGGPLVPFAVIEVAGSRSLTRFAGDLERGQEDARRTIMSSEQAELAAVAWDGYLTAGGERTDAVFVEASEAGDPHSVVLAQRYRRAGRVSKKMETFGNAALVKRGPTLL